MSAPLNLRTSAVNAIRRAKERVSSADLSGADCAQLEQELRSITAHYERFVENHQALVSTAMEKELEAHDNLWEQVDTFYNSTCVILNRRLKQLDKEPLAAIDLGADSSRLKGTSLAHNMDIRLDPVKIPPFDGALHNWLAFRDSFETLIHKAELPEAYKLAKLRQAIDPAKVPLIGGMYTGGYEEVWQALINRFDNPKLLAEIHVSRLLQLKVAHGETSDSLLCIVDTVQESLRALRVMKLPVEKWDALVVPMVVYKLPSPTQREWCMVCSSSEIPVLEDLLAFLEKRAQSLATELVRPLHRHEGSTTRQVRTPTVARSHVVTANGGKCSYCHGPHRISRCQRLLDKSPGQRFAELKDSGLCFNCLMGGHTSLQCSSSGCRQCGRKHHTMFCRATTCSTPESSAPSTAITAAAAATTNQSA